MPGRPRRKGNRSHLAVECTRPATGDRRPAPGARTLRGKVIGANSISVPFDECLAAGGAGGVLEPPAGRGGSPHTRTGAPRVPDRAAWISGRRWCRRAGHPVVGVERRDVPRDVRRDAGEETPSAAEFLVGVVEAGHEQRHDLDPEPDLVERRDASRAPAARRPPQFRYCRSSKPFRSTLKRSTHGARYSSTSGVPLPFDT